MDFNIIMYIFFGIVAVGGGLILITAKHPIRSALGLLTTMLALSGMYAILHAHSIAAFQVIIYAGAIMVLIIYFIMLLDIKSEDYLKSYSPFFKIGAPVVTVIVLFLIYRLYAVFAENGHGFAGLGKFTTAEVGEEFGSIRTFSKILLTNYLFAFEFVSTLLFAAIVAVIAIVQLDWKGRKNE